VPCLLPVASIYDLGTYGIGITYSLLLRVENVDPLLHASRLSRIQQTHQKSEPTFYRAPYLRKHHNFAFSDWHQLGRFRLKKKKSPVILHLRLKLKWLVTLSCN
jgi:hypothetical protein